MLLNNTLKTVEETLLFQQQVTHLLVLVVIDVGLDSVHPDLVLLHLEDALQVLLEVLVFCVHFLQLGFQVLALLIQLQLLVSDFIDLLSLQAGLVLQALDHLLLEGNFFSGLSQLLLQLAHLLFIEDSQLEVLLLLFVDDLLLVHQNVHLLVVFLMQTLDDLHVHFELLFILPQCLLYGILLSTLALNVLIQLLLDSVQIPDHLRSLLVQNAPQVVDLILLPLQGLPKSFSQKRALLLTLIQLLSHQGIFFLAPLQLLS